jgi:hypothetical protein
MSSDSNPSARFGSRVAGSCRDEIFFFFEPEFLGSATDLFAGFALAFRFGGRVALADFFAAGLVPRCACFLD